MINFRGITQDDIDQIISWLRVSHVHDVWDSAQGVSNKVLRTKYQNRLQDASIETYIIQINEIDVGLIQTYFIDNQVEFNLLDKVAMGIDLFIGDVNYINKGYGTKLLQQFITQKVFTRPEVQYVCIDPEVANERAIRSYEKVGFQIVRVDFSKHSHLLTAYMTLMNNKKKA